MKHLSEGNEEVFKVSDKHEAHKLKKYSLCMSIS